MDRNTRIQALVKMLSNEPSDLFLNYALGLEYSGETQHLTDAESQFKIVLAVDAQYLAAYYQLGILYEKLQRNSDALEFYRQGLTIAKQIKNLKSAGEFEEAIFLLED